MASFDIDAYFANKLGHVNSAATGKRDLVAQAVHDKQIKLAIDQADMTAAIPQILQDRAAAEASLAGQLGLTSDSASGRAVNLGASVVEGAINIPRYLATSIHGTKAGIVAGATADQAKAAHARYQNDEASVDDMALLNQPADNFSPNSMEYHEALARNGGKLETNLERLNRAGESVRKAAMVRSAMDPSSLVYRGNQNQLTEEVRAGFQPNADQVLAGWEAIKNKDLGGVPDLASGVAGLFMNIGNAALNNKQAAAEFIATNIPQLVLAAGGGAGMAMTNLPYAIDAFTKGIEAHQKNHGGAMPDNAKLAEMAGVAASMALSETVGDKITLGMGRVAKPITDGVANAAQKLGRDGFKASLLNASRAPLRVAGAGLGGGTGEFFTEAYQTSAENYLEGKPVTAEDAYIGGAVGALAGTGLAGGMRAGAELIGATPEAAKKREVKQQEKVEQVKQAVELGKDIQSGDVTKYVDKDAPTYAPDKAVQVLFGHSQQDSVPMEDKLKNLDRATELVETLKKDKDVLTKAIRPLEDILKEKQAELAKTGPQDPAKQDLLQEQIAFLREEMKTDRSTEDKDNKRALRKIEAQLNTAQLVLDEFHSLVKERSSQDEVATVIAEANKAATQDTTVARKAVDKVINLSMLSPDKLSTKQVNDLVDNETNALTTTERHFLRQFAAARVAENQLKNFDQVSQEILHGSPANKKGIRFVGINQYRQQITRALSRDNRSRADTDLAALANFAASHTEKAALAQEAHAEAVRAGEQNKAYQVQLLRDADTNTWYLNRDQKNQLSRRAVLENGGWTFHSGTPESRVEAMAAEATAIQAALDELTAAHAVKYGEQEKQKPGEKAEAHPVSPKTSQQEKAGVDSNPIGPTGPTSSSPAVTTTSSPSGMSSIEDDTEGTPRSDGNKLPSSPIAAAAAPATTVEKSRAVRHGTVVPVTTTASAATEKARAARQEQAQADAGKNPKTNLQLAQAKKDATVLDVAALDKAIRFLKDSLNDWVATQALPAVVEKINKGEYTTSGLTRFNEILRLYGEYQQAFADEEQRLLKAGKDDNTAQVEAFNHARKTVPDGPAWNTILEAADYLNSEVKYHYSLPENGKVFLQQFGQYINKPSASIPAAVFETIEVGDKVADLCLHTTKTIRHRLSEAGFVSWELSLPKQLVVDEDGNPVIDAKMDHYAAAIIADGKIYVIDRPQAEFAFRKKKGDLYLTMRGKGEYTPRLIEVTDKVLSGEYGGTNYPSFPGVIHARGAGITAVYQALLDQGIQEPQSPAAPDTPATAPSAPAGVGARAETETENKQTAAVTNEAVEPTGTLATYSEPANPDAPYQQQNLLTNYTVQKAGKASDGSLRPLVMVKDFLSSLDATPALIESFLASATLASLTDKQKVFLDLLIDKGKQWNGQLQKSLSKVKNPSKVKNSDFRYKDPIQFLLQETTRDGVAVLDLEENVKTAMIVSAITFLYENAAFGQWSTSEDINKLLGHPNEAEVHPWAEEHLAQRMTHANVLRASLGAKVREALGIAAKPDAPQDLLPRLDSALGTHVEKLLLERGLLTRHEVSADVMAVLRGVRTSEDVEAEWAAFEQATAKAREAGEPLPKRVIGASAAFLSLAWGEDGKLPPEARAIVEASSGTQGILPNLFSIESGLVEPSLEPMPFKQKTTDGTDQGVPNLLTTTLDKNQKDARFINQPKWKLLKGFTDEMIAAMGGAKSDDPSVTQLTNRKKNKAKKDGILREWRRFRDFVENTLESQNKLDAPLHFRFSAWMNQRVGILTNAINPQMSKLHRYLVYSKDWVTTIKLNDAAAMDNFKLRVLEGLGVKTDKEDSSVSLARFEAYFANPGSLVEPKEIAKAAAYKEAIDALMLSLDNWDMSNADRQAIVDGVAAGGEKFHSLDALMAMAQYRLAEAGGASEFTTTLMGETDGVNNGPMLSFLLYGAANSVDWMYERLNRGGFFRIGDKHSQYNQWRSVAGNRDLYENTAVHINDEVGRMINKDGSLQSSFTAIYYFTKPLVDSAGNPTKEGRNLIKTPTAALTFGSGIKKAVGGMYDALIDNILGSIEDAAKLSGDEQAAKVQEISGYLQVLFSAANYYPPRIPSTMEELLEWEMSRADKGVLNKAFMDTLGKAAINTLRRDFADYIARRDALNNIAQLTFAMYDAAYRTLRNEFLEEQMNLFEQDNKQGVAFGVNKGKRVPRHDLTRKQEAALQERIRKLLPEVHTAMSKADNDMSHGMMLGTRSRELGDNPAYTSEIRFGTGIPGMEPVWNSSTRTWSQPKSLSTNAYAPALTGPGVGLASKLTHSLDSMISHLVQKDHSVLNGHDALTMGLDQFAEVPKALNQSAWQVLLDYSPQGEVYLAFARQINNLELMMRNGDLSQAALQSIAAAVQQFGDKKMTEEDIEAGDGVLETFLKKAKQHAYGADFMKYSTMLEMAYVDQYANEGGHYQVTDADRAAVQAKLDALDSKITPTTLAAARKLDQQLEKQGKDSQDASAVAAADDAALFPDMEEAVLAEPVTAAPPVTHSAWGALGASEGHDSALVAAFEQTPVMDRDAAIKLLRERLAALGGPANLVSFRLKLVALLAKTVPASVKLRYVTATTPAADVLEQGADGSRGWYVSKGGKAEIYVLGADHVDAKVDPEVMLHEMTHAALADIVESETEKHNADPKYNSSAWRLVRELEELRVKAEAYINQHGLDDHRAAVKDVHELIAWGMSNLAFQKEVLAEINMTGKTSKNKLVKAMSVFINNITALIFRNREAYADLAARNGMSILVSNVSGLFYAAGQQQANTTTDIVLNQQAPAPTTAASYSTEELYQAVHTNTVSPGFDTKLRGVLASISTKLHGPFGSFKQASLQRSLGTPDQVWTQLLQSGEAPFAAQSLQFGVASKEEAFVMEQVEATVREFLDQPENSVLGLTRELQKLYRETRERLSKDGREFHDGDWAQATPNEKQLAQQKYDYVFQQNGTDGNKIDYLSRFAALGLAHQDFNRVLGFVTKITPPVSWAGKSLAEVLQGWFEKLLSFIAGLTTGALPGQVAHVKLTRLVDRLVEIEGKRRLQLDAQLRRDSLLEPLEESALAVVEKAKQKLGQLAGTAPVRNSKQAVVRAGGAVTRLWASNRVEDLMNALEGFRDQHFAGVHGVVMGAAKDARGMAENAIQLLRGTKRIEALRKEAISLTSNMLLQGFVNQGKGLTKKDREAITQIFLHTDAQSLLGAGKYTLTQLRSFLLPGSSALHAEIAQREQALAQHGPALHAYLQEQAKGLAYYMVTNRIVLERDQQLNASNITHQIGRSQQQVLSEDRRQQVEQELETLVSLYALLYADSLPKQAAAAVLDKELQRTDGNGVELVLLQHRALAQQAKERLFAGSEALMVKGYVPEIYDPYTAIQAVEKNSPEEAALKAQGFIKVHELGRDMADPDQHRMVLYQQPDGGPVARLTGAMSYSELAHRGSTIHSGVLDPNNPLGLHNAQRLAAVRNVKGGLAAKPLNWDPSKEKKIYLTPVVNANREIVNYRYLMIAATKDTVLRRTNDFDQVLGMYAGGNLDKQASPPQNRKVMEALHTQFQAEFARNPDAFIRVGTSSPDPHLREIWKLLPEQTRQDMTAIWGRDDSILVRKDMVDIIFGYRKLSLSTIFDKDPAYRNEFEKMFAFMAEKAFKGQAQLRTKQIERGWQEVVREAKDIIVVRSYKVLRDNAISNVLQLVVQGVSMKDIFRHHLVAIRGATDWQKDRKELHRLRVQLETGYTQGNDAEIRWQIAVVEDALERNPVRTLIEAGLMPTIVEDVSNEEDPYSYKSMLTQKMERFTSKINPTVLKVAKTALVTRDTPLYKALSRATQLSDFVARYTLYQHLTTRRKNPLTHAQAVEVAGDTFVNYDIPLHQTLQYTDDMGLTMFTKYFLRIQRVIFRQMQEHPARTLSAILLDQYLVNTPIITDTSMLVRFGNNPLHLGPLQLFTALDDPVAISAGLALIK